LSTRFEIEGRVYDYDGKISVEDAMFIHEKSGLGMAKFNQELLAELNPSAVAAWIYILKRRAGEAVRWQDVLKLDMRTFNVHFDEEPDETAEAATPDPTTPGTPLPDGTSST
jgi:hypothetical protein